MSALEAVSADLHTHRALCLELLELVEREHQVLCASDAFPFSDASRRRQQLLPRLDLALRQVKHHRLAWQQFSATQRQQAPDVPSRIRQIQDLILKILTLDRENEQLFLRRGMVPATRLPPAARQRPHFVADLYRQHRPPGTPLP
jgi:hypothetical protein